MLLIFIVVLIWFFWIKRPKKNNYTANRANSVVAITGSLIMLSQRMMKDHLMLGAGVSTRSAHSQRDVSVMLFNQRLEQLKKEDHDEAMQKLLANTQAIWDIHQPQILAQPDLNLVGNLMQDNDRLLALCDDIARSKAEHEGDNIAKMAYLAGRQRMLSQRIARNCVAIYWGYDNDWIHYDLDATIALFDHTLRELMHSRLTTPQLAASLEAAASFWMASKATFKLFQDSADKRKDVPHIQEVTETLLVKLDKITSQYEAIIVGEERPDQS
ncbi:MULTISPECIES: type IV pili methyl-accepting chemotaxis transducer N-terminal domain-containing protein [unclassified Oceanobacter]|uniref:type IV pili methyl-accepting chemotaxis transducer N-terminal domain-containing protein n=1 Tax=unclassified Oceanobacter TaxID=2620260 RepID=UPI0026E37B42|nr:MULTISPECIES: type IV pili methyl-accepting chemotaxis transducer N-terminal domain-containing protein [unclassified Oceanobacter]MDO6681002.1 type IV pili methyl-accepting chemotaxis transducer N-terminal domain-containing protein [Oceanobacter sp. 5_MG-2023]MDP2504426.1 type IV pili methyl-accepting chemotaxis transducer N-terminal domain-containing protein [Oceanobacter sp. 3_MG-2023]MDP2548322.1 type IV pili methyl-accepting chemotaxis transducer N-terminal domain-containing protein [Ocea